jgi:repressor of nif and glnA expression
MSDFDSKLEVAILRVLRETKSALGSEPIARLVQSYGLEPSGRTVRLYLEQMERKSLVTLARRGRSGGRTITALGEEELRRARVLARVGFTAAKVDTLACQMDFDLSTRTGKVVVNVTLIDEGCLDRAIAEMTPVFEAGLGMGEYIALLGKSDPSNDTQIPAGKIGIGTVCSVTINGVLLRAGIPTVSRFGGVLEMQGGELVRFTDVIYYDGTSLDPVEVFIRAGLTSAGQAARTGNGRIGVSFREVPTAAVGKVEGIRDELQEVGLDGILLMGKPNQPFMEFPVHDGRTGMLVAAGLNPAAALSEAGIPTTNISLCNLYDFGRMVHYADAGKMATLPPFHLV